MLLARAGHGRPEVEEACVRLEQGMERLDIERSMVKVSVSLAKRAGHGTAVKPR